VGRQERNQGSRDALEMKVAFGEQGFQPVAVPVDDREQGDGRGAARPELQRRIHSRRARGPDGAQGEQHVICPHNTQTQRGSVNILQFAATTPNIGPYMEYVWRAPARRNPGSRPISRSRTA